MRLPGWVMGYVRAGSILGMFFGLLSILLMMSGAPKHPIYWPTVWTSVGLILFAASVFIGTLMPMSASQSVAGAAEHGVVGGVGGATMTGADDMQADNTGDEEMYTGPATVVDTEQRTSMTPDADLADGASTGTTQRRAMADPASGGANTTNATNTVSRRSARPRP